MRIRRPLTATIALLVALGLTPVANAGHLNGTARCGQIYGHVALRAEQTNANDLMTMTLNGRTERWNGLWHVLEYPGARSGIWSVSSDSLSAARGYCKPD